LIGTVYPLLYQFPLRPSFMTAVIFPVVFLFPNRPGARRPIVDLFGGVFPTHSLKFPHPFSAFPREFAVIILEDRLRFLPWFQTSCFFLVSQYIGGIDSRSPPHCSAQKFSCSPVLFFFPGIIWVSFHGLFLGLFVFFFGLGPLLQRPPIRSQRRCSNLSWASTPPTAGLGTSGLRIFYPATSSFSYPSTDG